MLINFIPTEENHTIDLPKEWYGKEVTIEIKETSEVLKVVLLGDVLPKNLKNYDFWKDMPYDPNFPSLEEIRKNDKDPWEKPY